MALLELRGVTKRFGGLVANDGVDLDVAEGEILGIIGPNGAGKTTLFNLVAGFYPPDDGSIRFAGREVGGLAAEEVCRLGIARTFQITRSLKDMTVLENVLVGALCRTLSVRRAGDAAREVLALMGLEARADTSAATLTIADKKRLELARALATRPRMLLLDEVMAGLTPKETVEAVALIRGIKEQGVTLLVVEHVMEVIMPISNRVVVLDGGRKIAEGPPVEIARNPDVIQAYLGDRYRA
jgi:branched-chain amino acid transport system ATP-binding protein